MTRSNPTSLSCSLHSTIEVWRWSLHPARLSAFTGGRHLTKIKCKNAAKARGNGNGQYGVQLRAAEKIGPADEAFRKVVGASYHSTSCSFVAVLDRANIGLASLTMNKDLGISNGGLWKCGWNILPRIFSCSKFVATLCLRKSVRADGSRGS